MRFDASDAVAVSRASEILASVRHKSQSLLPDAHAAGYRCSVNCSR